MTQSKTGSYDPTDQDQTPDGHVLAGNQSPYNQKEEAAKAIRFMAIKAVIFILIPVIASALAVVFLL